MPTPKRQSVREARKTLSQTLRGGKTIAIGDQYKTLRGFIVGVPAHNHYSRSEKNKALKLARAAFIDAWKAERES